MIELLLYFCKEERKKENEQVKTNANERQS